MRRRYRSRAGSRRRGLSPEAAEADSAHPLAVLQQRAGNAAVTAALVARDVADEHVVPAAFAGDVPDQADVAGLKTELAEVKARIKQAKTDRTPVAPADVARQAEIERKLKFRRISDDAETLRINGITGGSAAWFADVSTVRFLNKNVTVHKRLHDRLKLAEAALASETPPPDGWVTEEHSGLRPAGQGLHAFGLAIDLNPGHNPWLVKPNSPSVELPALSQEIQDVIERAVLLVLGRNATEEDFQKRPDAADKNARVEASYDKLSEASGAFKQYLALDRPGVEALVRQNGAKDAKHRSVDDWMRVLAADKRAIPVDARAKDWADPAQQGFLNLDKRLVRAMTDSAGANLDWLGDDTIAAGRDIMHFDMRNLGPITRVFSGGTTIGLGSG